jgi:hypothetical protein
LQILSFRLSMSYSQPPQSCSQFPQAISYMGHPIYRMSNHGFGLSRSKAIAI